MPIIPIAYYRYVQPSIINQTKIIINALSTRESINTHKYLISTEL